MEKKNTTLTIIVKESLAWGMITPLLAILYAVLGLTIGKAAHISNTFIIVIGIFLMLIYFGSVTTILLTGILSRMGERKEGKKQFVSLTVTENRQFLGIKFMKSKDKPFLYPYYGAYAAHVMDSSGEIFSMVLKENECDLRTDFCDFPYGMIHHLGIDEARDMVTGLVLNSFFATSRDAARHLKGCVDSLPEIEITDEARSYLLSLAN